MSNSSFNLTVPRPPLYGCAGEVKGSVSRLDSYAYGLFLTMQLLLSIFGNTLVCIAIAQFEHLQTLTNSFILSLAITDLLTPFFRVSFIAISMLRQTWIFGCFWCKLSSFFGNFLCASSIIHLCAISVERSVVIRRPLQFHYMITKKRVIAALINIWVFSLLVSLFPYFGLVRLTFNLQLLDCEIHWRETPKMSLVLACTFFLLPFVLMSVTYYLIFKEVKKQTRKISMLELSQPSPEPINGRRKTLVPRIRVGRILQQELKAVKIIVVVMGQFFAFWLPYFVITSVRAYLPAVVSGSVQRMALAFAYSNSSCNWIVYSVMNRELRTAFKRLLLPFYRRCSKLWHRVFTTKTSTTPKATTKQNAVAVVGNVNRARSQ